MIKAGRILIASWDGGGNVPPALNLGARLVQQGHQVRLLGWETMAQRAVASGLEFAAYPSVPPWPAGVSLEKAWRRRLIPALFGPDTGADIQHEIESFAPDVVVTDCMLGAGLEIADTIGLPRAILIHVHYGMFIDNWGDKAIRAKNAAYLDRAGQVLVAAPPGLDPARRLPPNTSEVGPICDPDPGAPLSGPMSELLAEPGDPWILISLGTTLQDQGKALPRILEAVGRLPVRALLTLGGVLPPSAVAAPPNVTVSGFIAHDLLMPHMAAVVSHGGLSTVTATLAAGVPLVCIALGRDQSYNAARVAASGAGRAVDKGASPAVMAATIQDVLADSAFTDTANQFAKAISVLGYGDVAAQKVAALVGG